MVEMQATVGGGRGAIGSPINSPLCQKFSLKSKSNYKNNKKAFSVAEATIALLIGSVALGMAAPMITKQVKQNNFTDTQFQVLRKEIERLRENQNNIPSGAVMFFDLASCPDTWSPLTETYPNAAGSFLRNLGETVEQGKIARSRGSFQKNAAPDIDLALRIDAYDDYAKPYYKKWLINEYGREDGYWGVLTYGTDYNDEVMAVMSSAKKENRAGDLIKPDTYDTNVKEIRPDNIALLACRKD